MKSELRSIARCARSTDWTIQKSRSVEGSERVTVERTQERPNGCDSIWPRAARKPLYPPPLGDVTVTEHDPEVNKMPHPEPVLFAVLDQNSARYEALQAIFSGNPIPEGGPFCVCAPRAIVSALHGVPVPCGDLPWKCPFPCEIESTPTS